MSDPHIDSLTSRGARRCVSALELARNLRLVTIVIAGDLVNNWADHILLKHGDQFPADFSAFRRLIAHFAFKHIIDEFGVLSFDSNRHRFRSHTFGVHELLERGGLVRRFQYRNA